MPEKDAFRENLERSIAADIVLSGAPGETIRRWREVFGIYQADLAREMQIRSSIISDYESGRRKSPGAAAIKNLAEAFVSLGMNGDTEILRTTGTPYDAIIDSRNMRAPLSIDSLSGILSGTLIADGSHNEIPGYVIVDSLSAIVTFSQTRFLEMYKIISGNAVIFAHSACGRFPLVAIKVARVRPAAVIFYGIKKLDRVAENIARTEKIPVILSDLKTVDEIILALKPM